MTKRFNIITAIVVCALLAVFGLAIAWICINKDALVSGSKIYTQEQVEKMLEEHGEKRYQDGLEQNKTAEELMKKYKSELENEQTAHLKTKAELQKEKEKTNQDQARIAELEARLAAQEETLTRLSGLIESYEEIKNGTYELSFKVDGKLYKTIAVVKNGNVKNLPNDPQKEGYAFEGWVEEGTETLVDFTTYTATKDTTFTAKFTKTYEVKFVSNDVEIKTSMVKENGFAEAPATPEGDFVGWTLNGTDVVDVAATPITANTTFIARFKQWTSIYTNLKNNLGLSSDLLNETTFENLKAGDSIIVEFACIHIDYYDVKNAVNKEGYLNNGIVKEQSFNNNTKFSDALLEQTRGKISSSVTESVKVNYKGLYPSEFSITISCIEDGKLTLDIDITKSGNSTFELKNVSLYIIGISVGR